MYILAVLLDNMIVLDNKKKIFNTMLNQVFLG